MIFYLIIFFSRFFVWNYHGKSNLRYLQIWPAELSLSISKHYFLILPRSDTSIQTQRNSASDASVGANDVAPSGLDQSTNHHGNTDVKYNDDSQ